MIVKINKLATGKNYAVSVDGVEIFADVRHPLPMLAGRLFAKGYDGATVLDFQNNEGPVMRSAPLSELIELPRPRIEPLRGYQRAVRAA